MSTESINRAVPRTVRGLGNPVRHTDGYGHRLTARYNSTNTSTDHSTLNDDPVDVYSYDELWRVRTVTRATPSSTSTSATWTSYVREQWFYHTSDDPSQYKQGSDAPVMRRINTAGNVDSGGNSIFDTTQHFVTNRQGSVVAVLDEAAAVSESDQSLGGKPGFPIAYVHYDTYGTPTICDPADIDRDGVVDLRDVAAYIVYWQKYHAGTAHSDRYKDILDFDRSGAVATHSGDTTTAPDGANADYLELTSRVALVIAGTIPDVKATLGRLPLYCGYWWDADIEMYHVRHRVYRPQWGKWIQRDPLGYLAGWNLYEYVGGEPWREFDPEGLWMWGLVSEKGFQNASNWIQNQFAGKGPIGTAIGAVTVFIVETANAIDSMSDPVRLVEGLKNAWESAKEREDTIAYNLGYKPNVFDYLLSFLGEVSGANTLAGGAYGVDTHDWRTVSGWERFEMAVSGGAQFVSFGASTLAGGLEVVRMVESRAGPGGKGSSKTGDCNEGARSCFTAGTEVATSHGEEAIEDVSPGERVLTGGENSKDEYEEEEPDPKTWRLFHLQMIAESTGDVWEINVLKPATWLLELSDMSGDGTDVPYGLEEQGVYGQAKLVGVEACPPIEQGEGRVVTATIRHMSTDVYQVRLSGATKVLEPTGLHRLYSVDRDDWVATKDLRVGEQLETIEGETRIESIARKPGLYRVFNLTVQTDHRYFAGESPVLGHNDCGGESPAAENGRRWHEFFKRRAKSKGWETEPTLKDPLTGKNVKPDAVTKNGRPVEYKPNSRTGRSAGKTALKKYQRATGKNGRVIYYDPTTSPPPFLPPGSSLGGSTTGCTP